MHPDVPRRGRPPARRSSTPPRAGSLSCALLGVLLFAGCDDVTGPAREACGAPILDPGVSLRSGFTPPGRVSLLVGSTCTLSSGESESFALGRSDGAAEYLVAIQSASTVAGAVSSIRLWVRGPNAPSATSSADRASSRVPLGPEAWSSSAELRLRHDALRELERVGARPFRPGGDPRIRPSVAAAPPTVGETVTFRNSVAPDLSVDCDGPDVITAVVKAVGTEFAVAEDIEAAGHIGAAEYGDMLDSLERLVFPVDTAYFGAPADLDGNDRVWALVTVAVNRVTPRGSGTFIAGFFNPSDLSDPATCAASNRGELLYLLAPDPTGRFSNPVPPAFAVSNAIGVSSHELEHLLSAEQRVGPGGGTFADLEDAWLGEGMAHTAESVVGWKAGGLAPQQNLGFAALDAVPGVFAAFHLANFRRTGYYLEDPSRTLALGTSSNGDPGGVPSLRMRGFAWLFLRWMADHASVGGGGVLGGKAEEEMFRELSSGGQTRARGVANVERVAGPLLGVSGWRRLLSRYAPAPGADDRASGAPPSTQLSSFDLPDVFGALHASLPDKEPFGSPYPLDPDVVRLDSTVGKSFDVELGASTAAYFLLESDGPHPDIRITLTTPSGAGVPVSVRPQIVLLRTR